MAVHLFSIAAAVLYLVAAAGYVRLVRSDSFRGARLLMPCLIAGLACHAMFLGLLGLGSDVPTLPRVPHTLSLLALAIVAAYVPLERLVLRERAIGAFVVPLSALLMLLSAACYHLSGSASPIDAPAWLVGIHLVFLLGSYVLFILALGVNFAVLVQESRLKRKAAPRKERYPSIVTLDRVNRSLLSIGLVLLLTGVTVGWTLATANPDTRPLFEDPRVVWTSVTVIIYATLVTAITRGGIGRRRAVYLSFVGFLTIVASFLGGGMRSGNFHAEVNPLVSSGE